MQWRTACAHTLPPDILSLAHRCVAECQRADRAQETAESTKKQTDTDLKMDGATATDVAKEEATTLEDPAVEDAKEDSSTLEGTATEGTTGSSSFRALFLIGVVAAICAAFITSIPHMTKPSVANKLVAARVPGRQLPTAFTHMKPFHGMLAGTIHTLISSQPKLDCPQARRSESSSAVPTQWLPVIVASSSSRQALSGERGGAYSNAPKPVVCAHSLLLERSVITSGDMHITQPARRAKFAPPWCINGIRSVRNNSDGNARYHAHLRCDQELVTPTFRVGAPHGAPLTLMQGYGDAWKRNGSRVPGSHHWPDYTTILHDRNTGGNQSCFWPKVPTWVERARIKPEDPTQLRRVPLVVISDGFVDNFWHASGILNSWCEMRFREDVTFVMQPKHIDDNHLMYRWSEALGIPRNRIATLEQPIMADSVIGVNHEPQWDCLSRTLRLPYETPNTIVVYVRPYNNPSRDMPYNITQQLAAVLGEAFPHLTVKMFLGSETLMEARQIFSSARLVIGPHGSGLCNVVFCQKWTPVIEFLSEQAADRPWQMWGGHSVGLPWWPLVVESLANSDDILDLGLQTAKLALAHAAR